MNSSLNDEVIYLSLNANTKTSEVYTFIQTALRWKIQRAQHIQGTTGILTIIIFLL